MKKATIFLCLLFTITMLQGCKGGSSSNSSSTVRLVNGYSSALNMYWNGSASPINSTPISYGNASASAGISAGISSIELAASGVTPSPVGNLSFGGGNSYTIVAYPSYSSGQNGQVSKVSAQSLTDNQVTPASGNALIGVADFSGAGSLDVYILAGSTPPAPPVNPWASNISGISNYFPIPLPSTTGTTSYHIQVTGAGAGYNNDVRLDIPVTVGNPVNIGNQQILTLVLTPTTGGELVDGMVIFQQGQTLLSGQLPVTSYKNGSARVRIAASFVAAGNSPITSATAKGVSILGTNLSSGSVSSYVSVPLTTNPQLTTVSVGSQSLPITINGISPSVSASCPNAPVTATPGQDLTLLVIGSASAPQYCLLSDDNTLADSGYAKVRLVNGVNSLTGSISLSYNGSQSLPPTAAVFGAASTATNEIVNLNSPAILDVSFGGTNYAVGTTCQISPSPTLTPQGVYSVFVLGDTSAATCALSTDHLYQ